MDDISWGDRGGAARALEIDAASSKQIAGEQLVQLSGRELRTRVGPFEVQVRAPSA